MIDLSASRTRKAVSGFSAQVRASQTVTSRPKSVSTH